MEEPNHANSEFQSSATAGPHTPTTPITTPITTTMSDDDSISSMCSFYSAELIPQHEDEHDFVQLSIGDDVAIHDADVDVAAVDVTDEADAAGVLSPEPVVPNARTKIHTISVNQDHDCIVVGTNHGCYIRQINNANLNANLNSIEETPTPNTKQILTVPPPPHTSRSGCHVVACQMLHRTNLLAVVYKHSSRTVFILDSKTGSPLCQPLQFVSLVLRLALNSLFLCVLCNNGTVSIYDIETLTRLKTLIVSGTIRNVFVGRCYFDMTPVAKDTTGTVLHPCWIVCQTLTRGELNVYDRTLKLVERFSVFEDNNIGLMAVGGSGGQQFLAVAEDQGCVIRILSLPNGTPTHSLYRGSKPCRLFSISIHSHRTGTNTAWPWHVAVSGDTGTVHVFRLEGTAATSVDGADAKQTTEPPNDGRLTQMLPLSNLLSMIPLSIISSQSNTYQRSICKVKPFERDGVPWNTVLLHSTQIDPNQGEKGDREQTLVMSVASSNGTLIRYWIRNGHSEFLSTESLLS